MKQAAGKPLDEASTVPASDDRSREPNAVRDLAQWVDEVAALLPEESRLGWYQNVRPWLRMLPPDDEIAHLAYSMGYLALLTRSTPALMAAERAKMAAMLHRLTDEDDRYFDNHRRLSSEAQRPIDCVTRRNRSGR